VIRSTSLRLAAGTVALALPLAAAAGCGAEKRKTIKAEFASAASNLEGSKAASFTLRLDDAQGNLAKLAKKSDGAPPAAVVDALLKGSITYIVDPVGDATFKSATATKGAADLKSALNKVNLAFVVRDGVADVAELRLVAGDLYAHVNLTEIGRLATLGGAKDFNSSLDDAVTSMDPRFAQGLADVRAGKWLKLPLSKYLDQLQGLAGSMAPQLGGSSTGKKYDFNALGKRAYAAVKPYVKVTDANDSSSDRVLDVNVQVRPALKALLALLQSEKGLPFAGMLGSVMPSEIDKNVTDGIAHGTITLKSSHLRQVAVDIESIRTLSTDPGTDTVAGARVVVDINDDAAALTAPTDVSSFDIGQIIDGFLQNLGSFQS
jgi:hypothetical protein